MNGKESMKTIHKFVLRTNEQPVEMPVGAEILTAREQGDNICVWAMVDAQQTMREKRALRVFGTGHELPDDPNLKYVGTAMLQGGALVKHVFESRFAN